MEEKKGWKEELDCINMTTKSLKLKKRIFYLILFSLMIPFILLLSEVILRISGRFDIIRLHFAEDPVFDQIPGMFEPGQDFIDRLKHGLPYHVSINSLGYRGREIERKKYPGSVRVLCLGDSFTYGSYVNDDETIPYKLQNLFEQKQEQVLAINGGVPGTTIVDQLYFLKKSIEIDPDIVILIFSLNDVPELNKAEPKYVSYEKNRKRNSSSVIAPVYRIFRDTALYSLASKLKEIVHYDNKEYSKQKNGLIPNSKNIVHDFGLRFNENALRKRYAELLRDMNDYLQKRSVKFMYVIFPSLDQIGKRTEFSNLHDLRVAWVERFAQEIGTPCVNLLKFFKKKNLEKKQLYLIPYDHHGSSLANTIASNAIFENLYANFPDIFSKDEQ